MGCLTRTGGSGGEPSGPGRARCAHEGAGPSAARAGLEAAAGPARPLRAPPPPAGRARRSAGRRPGACRVVPSRAARPRGDSPSGARAPLPPLDRSHFSCTTLRGGRGGAAGPAAGRYVLPGEPEPEPGGRHAARAGGTRRPGLRAAAAAASTCGRARGSAPQPSGETAGKRELLGKRSTREKRNINWAVSRGTIRGSSAVSCLKLSLLLRAKGTAAVLPRAARCTSVTAGL